MASRELSILVTARNMASRVLGQVRGDINGLEGAASRAGSNIGRNLAIGGAVVAGAITTQVRAGIDSLVELERVENLTAAALTSTGNLANQSAEGIRARSEAMERLTGVDDKAIQNAQNLLLTFTNVGEDAFEPTTQAALDLNAALGGNDESLQGVLLQVAKAINDPVRGMTALRRSGVSFTEEQQDQVRAMVEANDLMGAQALILGELQTQFGGAAEAANQGVGASQKRFGDAIEDMQMALATGFLPLIERVSGKLQELVADPEFLRGVENFGNVIASGFDEALDFAESVDWGAVGDAFGLMGTGAKAAMDMFLGAPPWLQTAIVTGWGLNKLTGGALGSIVGALGSGLIKGVLGMNAGVVNINAATVNGGGGGLPGAGGRAGGVGGFVAGAAGTAGAAAMVTGGILTLDDIATGTEEGVTRAVLSQGIPGLIGRAGQEMWDQFFPPAAAQEREELRNVVTAQELATAAARDAIPWAQRNLTASQVASARAEARAAVAAGNLSRIEGATRESTGVQRGILAKKSNITVSPIVQIMNNISINEWQRTVSSSLRAAGAAGYASGPI